MSEKTIIASHMFIDANMMNPATIYHGHQDVLRTVMGELGYVKQVICYSRHELAYLRVVIE